MNRQERFFYIASGLALFLLPILSHPFGLHTSLGFLAGTASGILVVSYSKLFASAFLTPKRKKYLHLSFLPRLALLFALAFFLSLYQDMVSPLTFVLGFVIIIFVMLLSYLAEE